MATTDQDISEIALSNALLGEDVAQGARKPTAKAGPSAFDTTWQAIAGSGQPARQRPSEPMNVDSRGINEALLTHPKEEIATFDRAKAQKQVEAQRRQQAQQAALQRQQILNSPWTQLSNALVQQYQQATQPAVAAMSGSLTPGVVSNASGTALASLGLSPSSGAGQWLSSQEQAAAAATAPVAQAMQAQGAQYAAETGPISKAIAAYGQANALADITAPEQGWLSALASHVTSNLSYYGEIPKADIPTLQQEPGLVQGLESAGGYAAGSAGSGLVPLNELTVNPSGQVVVNRATGALGPALGSNITTPGGGGGTIPAPTPHAG